MQSKGEREMQWLKYFMTLAKNVSEMSKDPSHKIGAVIVDQNKRIVSTGFNGFAKNIVDSDERLNDKDIKRKLTLHAEENAVSFAKRDLTGCDIYVYGYPPCTHCTSLLIQSGIKCIYYYNPTHKVSEHWKDDFELAETIANEVNIPYLELDI